MAPHKMADCVDCRINQRIRQLAKASCGDCLSTPCPYCKRLRAFGRAVAHAVKNELRREVDGAVPPPEET